MPKPQSPWRSQPNLSNFLTLLGRCMASWAPPIAGSIHPQLVNEERRSLERAYCQHGGIRCDDLTALAQFLELHFGIRCTSETDLRQRLDEANASLQTATDPNNGKATPVPPPGLLGRRRSTLRSAPPPSSTLTKPSAGSNHHLRHHLHNNSATSPVPSPPPPPSHNSPSTAVRNNNNCSDRYLRTDAIAHVVAMARRSIAADQLTERTIGTDDPALTSGSWSDLSDMIFSWLCGPENNQCLVKIICSFAQHLLPTIRQQVAILVDRIKAEFPSGWVSRIDFNETVFPRIRDASPQEDAESERTQSVLTSHNLQWGAGSRPRMPRNSSFVARQIVGAFKDLVANREDTAQLNESIQLLSRRSRTQSQVRARVLNDPKSYFKMPPCVLRAADLQQLMKLNPKLLRSFASRARKMLRNSVLKYARRWLSAIERAAELLQRHSERCERCTWYHDTSMRWSSPSSSPKGKARFQSFSGLGSVLASNEASRRGDGEPPIPTSSFLMIAASPSRYHTPRAPTTGGNPQHQQAPHSSVGGPAEPPPFTPRTTRLPHHRPHPADSPRLHLGNMEDAFVLNVYKRALMQP